MQTFGVPDPATLASAPSKLAARRTASIRSPSLTRARIYLFSGTNDHSVVPPSSGRGSASSNAQLGVPEPQIKLVDESRAPATPSSPKNAGHWRAASTGAPYITDCDYDQARDTVGAHLRRPLKPRAAKPRPGDFIVFDQRALRAGTLTSHGLDDAGIVYVPRILHATRAGCRVAHRLPRLRPAALARSATQFVKETRLCRVGRHQSFDRAVSAGDDRARSIRTAAGTGGATRGANYLTRNAPADRRPCSACWTGWRSRERTDDGSAGAQLHLAARRRWHPVRDHGERRRTAAAAPAVARIAEPVGEEIQAARACAAARAWRSGRAPTAPHWWRPRSRRSTCTSLPALLGRPPPARRRGSGPSPRRRHGRATRRCWTGAARSRARRSRRRPC